MIIVADSPYQLPLHSFDQASPVTAVKFITQQLVERGYSESYGGYPMGTLHEAVSG